MIQPRRQCLLIEEKYFSLTLQLINLIFISGVGDNYWTHTFTFITISIWLIVWTTMFYITRGDIERYSKSKSLHITLTLLSVLPNIALLACKIRATSIIYIWLWSSWIANLMGPHTLQGLHTPEYSLIHYKRGQVAVPCKSTKTWFLLLAKR